LNSENSSAIASSRNWPTPKGRSARGSLVVLCPSMNAPRGPRTSMPDVRPARGESVVENDEFGALPAAPNQFRVGLVHLVDPAHRRVRALAEPLVPVDEPRSPKMIVEFDEPALIEQRRDAGPRFLVEQQVIA